MTRQSPGKAQELDEVATTKASSIASPPGSTAMIWNMQTTRTGSSSPFATPVITAIGGSSSMSALDPMADVCWSIPSIRCGCRKAKDRWWLELFTRINWGLPIGGFEMDWSDGEVRVRTAMPLEQGDFTDKQFDHLFYSNLALADRYLAGIYGTAFGNVTPEMALEMATVPAKEELQ